MSTVDTKRVKDRRSLRFETLADAVAEVRRLSAAEREGRLVRLGNWTLGQAVNHLAVWTEYSFNGTPLPRPPLPVRLIARLMRGKILNGPMMRGLRIPNVEGGTTGADPVETPVAVARFESITNRLEREPPTHPNIVLGRLTHEECIKLQLRHAELHLGFFKTD